MRNGIHVLQQRRNIKYFQRRIRAQFWGMVVFAIGVVLLLGAYFWRPSRPHPSPRWRWPSAMISRLLRS